MVRSHVNSRTRSNPAARNRAANPASPNTRLTASAICPGSRGSNNNAASPATSGNDDVFEHATGTPRPIASNTGNPNPSCNDASTNTSARAYNASSCPAPTHPTNATATPNRSASSRNSTSYGPDDPANTNCTPGKATIASTNAA